MSIGGRRLGIGDRHRCSRDVAGWFIALSPVSAYADQVAPESPAAVKPQTAEADLGQDVQPLAKEEGTRAEEPLQTDEGAGKGQQSANDVAQTESAQNETKTPASVDVSGKPDGKAAPTLAHMAVGAQGGEGQLAKGEVQGALQKQEEAKPEPKPETKPEPKQDPQRDPKGDAPEDPQDEPLGPIADGAYVVKALAAPYATAFEVYGDSYDQGRVWANAVSGTYSQVWYFQREASGLYSVFSMHSGLALDASGGELVQAAFNGSDAQQFELRPVGRGFALVTASGLALTLAGESVVSSDFSGAYEQRFGLSAAPLIIPGMYSCLPTADIGSSIVIDGDSTEEGARLCVSANASDLAHKFVFSSANTVGAAIRSAVSNFYANASDGFVVQSGQRGEWNVGFSKTGDRRGLVFYQPEGLGLTFADSGGAALVLSTLELSAQQAFLPLSVRLVDNGAYAIASSLSGKTLDVADGRRAVYANVQTCFYNDTNAQKFNVSRYDGDLYTITNVATGRPLGSRDWNAEMLSWTGDPNQLWKIEPAGNGSLRFLNAGANAALNLADGNLGDFANINLNWVQYVPEQQFRLTPVTYAVDNSSIDIGVPVVWQYPELPTGCESVALTNALLYYGFDIGKETIADDYMPWSGDDFVYAFMGNPHSSGGCAIMAPGITNTANSFLASHGSPLRATNVTGTFLEDLYGYIIRGTPVVVWSTMYMVDPGGEMGSSDGYTMRQNTHAVTLAGYDRNSGAVLVSDPLDGSVWRDFGRFNWLYDVMGRQAVIIE